MAASNMSVQTTAEPSYMDRPSMKQDSHPEHNMPDSEHDGMPLSISAQGNQDLRNRYQGPRNVRSNITRGFTAEGDRDGMDAK